ncbi:MAG: dihydrofolate reductase [Bacteroidia bacterium]|nr:dihydrofolate reductase [Bacteroidia bacterium]
MQTISVIFAASENHVIGYKNQLPWRLSGDLKYFKRITSGKTVIMGRKTYESLGKPLPNRRNIVVSSLFTEVEGIEVAPNLNAALKLCEGEAEVFLIGGAQIFKTAFEEKIVDKIYFTLVHAETEGDTFFEIPDKNHWKIVGVEANQADEKNEYAYTFITMVTT